MQRSVVLGPRRLVPSHPHPSLLNHHHHRRSCDGQRPSVTRVDGALCRRTSRRLHWPHVRLRPCHHYLASVSAHICVVISYSDDTFLPRQLRDLVICPRERGVLNYVQEHSIVEHDIASNDSPRTLADLSFNPNTLAALPLNSHETLLAAGGQEAEIHLSYHTIPSSKGARSRPVWQMEQRLQGSINNSVFLTSLSLTRAHQSAVEPRVGISNNDCTIRLYEVPIRTQSQKRSLRPIGCLRLDVPINHCTFPCLFVPQELFG
ncbi:hypothetical protein P691DRAFT_123513 [Macrolepiota fuliginosa MF-IS2]|uniref:Uncharacterized protein n=1 Tax=Macrolepiota fuliginosa MF-IS2 TaxID=1400762 RepID=A0A9P5XDQ0_9AGAR|nr:hypothetical protein P691DRAFT_123513 [Macrolepiota fuliginosa MF-IS2]